jgi:hypothetical protein
MKFAKKIFVGIIAATLLVSCLAFSASAEAPELPVEKLTDVFEYLWYDTYLIEDYESQTQDAYGFVPSHYADEEKTVPYFSFIESNGAVASVVSDAANKYLSITNSSAMPVGYKMYFDEGGFKYFTASFDFKSGDAGMTNGSDVFVKATLRDYYDDIILFGANMSDDSAMQLVYSEYDEERITYSEKVADVAPEIGVWYRVDVVFSPENERYAITVKSGDSVVFSFEDKIDKSAEGIDSIRFYVSDAEGAGETKTYFDNITAYEGSSTRDVVGAMQTLATLAVQIDEYAKHEATPIDKKVEVADFYAQFYEGKDYGIYFTAPEGVSNYDAVDAVVKSAKEFRNKTYASALEIYTSELDEIEGYYEKLEALNAEAKRFYEMFKDTDYENMVGVDAAKVSAALERYEAAEASLRLVAEYSIAFVELVENNYDSKSKDFAYMEVKYVSMAAMIDRVASEFKYSDVNEDTRYPTVAAAIAEFEALSAKRAEIVNNAGVVFIPTVSGMEIVEAESVSAESPYLTENFEELYESYLTAKTVYANGTVHNMLDPATYPGLSDAIAAYLEYEAYINERIAECNEFIAAIKGAESSSYIVTIENQFKVATEFFDENKEKSLERYEGVEAAVASYDSIVSKLNNMKKAADDYIAAVNAIDLNASYDVLREAVAKARALKEAGSVTGYAGVDEADKKFAEADAKVGALEGHSATLISTVAALKNAKTLAERRELIYVALSAKDGAEDKITGVSAAKTELDGYIKAYNADVEAANAFFASVVGDSVLAMASATSDSAASNAIAVIAGVGK